MYPPRFRSVRYEVSATIVRGSKNVDGFNSSSPFRSRGPMWYGTKYPDRTGVGDEEGGDN